MILLQQALLLRGKLARPASPSTARPGSAAAAHAGRPGSAGQKGSGSSSPSTGSQKAQDLLHFLHSHVQRMQEQVHALSAGGAGTALWQLHGAIDAPAGQQEVSRAGMQHAKPNLSKADSPSDGLSQTGHRLSVVGAVRPQTAAASAGRPRSPGPRCIRPQTASPHGSSSAQTAQLQGMRFCATAVEAASAGATQQHRWQSQDLHVVAQGADRGINREPVPGSVGYPDLTPYLVFPPRRPVSPPAASTATHRQQTPAVQQAGFAGPAELQNSALVQELQQLLADREQQLQLQHDEIRGLQEQLQEALQQHAQMQQQLQDTEAQANTAAGSCAALQQQLEAAQQAALAAHAQAEAKQKQLLDQLDRRADVAAESEAASESSTQQQLLAANEIAAAQASQINQLQQQLTAAEAQVLALQQSMHEQQVQHIQSQQEAHQLLAQSEAAATAAAAAAAALQEAHAVAGAGGGAGSSSPRGQLVQLLQSLQLYSRQLAGLAPAEALLSGKGELQDGVIQLCEALQELVVKLKEVRIRLLLWHSLFVCKPPSVKSAVPHACCTSLHGHVASLATDTGPYSLLQDCRLCNASGVSLQAASQLLQQPELNTSPSSATRSSCNTEALEGQLEATRVEMAHCMDMLTEVVAATRRMSMAGPPGQPDAPVKRFSQLEVEWHPLPASVARMTDDSV